MNKQAAEALYDAGRRGVKQIIGRASDGAGGQCAADVLIDAGAYQDLSRVLVDACPLCGDSPIWRLWDHCEASLVIHLNDDHDLTFSEIARKLGPDSV